MRRTVVVLSIALASSIAPASAETVNCTAITAVPVNIDAPGIYCLTGNIVTGRAAGRAINIRKSNVVIDLNSFSLRNRKGPATTATGIYAKDQRNIVIRNGTIEGFYRGIWLDNDSDGSFNHLVEKVRAIGNGFAGIQVEGEDLVIRNNQVSQTGPSNDFTKAYGIYLNNFKSARVSENTVTDTQETAGATGIFALNGSHLVVEKNMVSDTNTATAKYALHLQDVNRAFVIGNRLINQIAGTTGIRNVSNTGVTCANNFIHAFTNTTSAACDSESGTLP